MCTNFLIVHSRKGAGTAKVDRPGESNLSILSEDVKGYQNNQKCQTIKNGEMEQKEVGGKSKYEKKNPQLYIRVSTVKE